jgi:hypothetical protein
MTSAFTVEATTRETVPTITCSRGVVAAEVDRHTAFFVVEHGDELEARAERFKVLTQRGDAYVVGVLELGDRSLGDLEAAGKLGLTHGCCTAQFVQPDLLERLGAQTGEPFRRTRLGDRGVAEFGELGSCHQISPSSPSSDPRSIATSTRSVTASRCASDNIDHYSMN